MNIIVGRNGKETVSRIADAIGADVYSKHFSRRSTFWRKNYNKMLRGYTPSVSGITINWAINPSEVEYGGIVYNENGIALSSNKPRARMAMQEAGVPTPRTTTDSGEALRWVEDGKTIVCRPATHRAGQNFFVIRPSTSQIDRDSILSMSDYYAEFFPKTREFRLHGGHGKVLVLQEKVPNRDGVDLTDVRPWNFSTGDFVFKVLKWSEFPISVCKAGLSAIKALGLDMGAVDIMSDEQGNVAVAEVNTSPSLEDYCTSRYAKYFTWLCESDERREHFEFEGLTLGKSFAWKECNFNESGEDNEKTSNSADY